MADLFFGFPGYVKKLILNKVIKISPISIMCIRLTCNDWNILMKKETLQSCCKTYTFAICNIFKSLFPTSHQIVVANEFLILFLKITKMKNFLISTKTSPKMFFLSVASSHDILVETQKQFKINYTLDDILKHGNSFLLNHYKDLFILDETYRLRLLQGTHSKSTVEWIFKRIISIQFLRDQWMRMPITFKNDRFNNTLTYILSHYNMPSEFYEALLLCCVIEGKTECFLKLQKDTNYTSLKICKSAKEKKFHENIEKVCFCNKEITLKEQESELKKIKL
jgi:hypothetical protein